MTHITILPDGRETEICIMEVIKFHKIYMTHKQIGPIKKIIFLNQRSWAELLSDMESINVTDSNIKLKRRLRPCLDFNLNDLRNT